MKKIAFIGLLILLTNLISAQTVQKDYLLKVLNNLEQIKSADYLSVESYGYPGDTLAYTTYSNYVKEHQNLSDSIIGAHFACFDQTDTTKINTCYDGLMFASIDWNEKTVRVAKIDRYNRPSIIPPFFTHTKYIIQYALNNSDSTKLLFKDYGDSVQFSLLIYDKIVNIYGNPMLLNKNEKQDKGKNSRYDIWINKSNDLPYRMRRKMPHQSSYRTCSNIHINSKNDVDFTANYYIPVDFKTLSFSNQVTPPSVLGLEGKPAPDWLLKDIDGKEYSLKNIKGDILMIQFTGIGCGHCHASIPFLKNLVSEYQNKNFKFISIESISSNVSGIKRYAEMNQINYLYLISNKETSKDYQVDGLPVFFIINKDRIIKKVMLGYDNNGVREKEIREAINSLL